jgi:hypothetical protein
MSLAPVAVAARPEPLPPWRKLGLAAEILGLYARARKGVRDNDLRAAVEDLRPALPAEPDGAEADGAGYLAGLRYGRAVTRLLTALPLDSRCLMQSLVLTGLLARRGIRCSLVIGVRPGAEFGAHAWVELDGRPLLPPQADKFERLLAL